MRQITTAGAKTRLLSSDRFNSNHSIERCDMSLPIGDYHPAVPRQDDFWEDLGIPVRGARLYTALHSGLPYEVFERLAHYTDLNRSTLAEHLGIAPATLQRRLKVRRFNAEESDRLFRLAAVYKAALDLFEGDTEATRLWLANPVHGLGNSRPLEMLATSAETQAVLDLIGRLEHGVVA
ncbi:putative toxin-antitoxin system antitoxin component [Pseudomonas coronafaciens pv. atropurpurea]|nr:putative toxin-antitoxin system antitoxin component [Pseudomonas coronafaciens pv. atropurpurea]